MQELSREAWAQAVVWAPTLLVALGIFLLFSLLARAAHFAVLRIVSRTRAHGPLGQLLASVARISLWSSASSPRSASR